MSFPKSDERKKCWAARDGFWQCLTDNDEDQAKCSKQRVSFENSCVKQWVNTNSVTVVSYADGVKVKYFDRRRDYLKYKEKIEKDGFDPIDSGSTKAKM